jgi:radical SAM protein with 4Fe4S-binding SPASM domain
MRSRTRWRYLARAPRTCADALRGTYEFTYDRMPLRLEGMSWPKRLNLLRAGLNLIARRPRPWSRPLHMQVELTSFCNLSCPVCPTGVGALDRPAKALDLDLLADVMDDAGPFLLTASLWGWGEPLLHPDFPRAVDIVGRHGVAVLISTNGQNLDDRDVLDGLLAAPPQYLIVALDGLTDETNSVYRAGARLAPALEGVRRLEEMKRACGAELPLVSMRYIVMKHNQHELPRLRSFAAGAGFDCLSVRTLSIIDYDESAHSAMVPDAEPYRAYDYDGGRRVRRGDFTCQWLPLFPALLSNGAVAPCDQDYNGRYAYGRVGRDGSFNDIWFGARAAETRRAMMTDPAAFSCCRMCPYADRPDNSCTVEHVDFRETARPPRVVPA